MEFTRINNDVNGNPRYVTHFLNIPLDADVSINERYALACKKANTIGGKKYHTKSFGGGIVFQSYNLDTLIKDIKEL
jgi:hypothetical protein